MQPVTIFHNKLNFAHISCDWSIGLFSDLREDDIRSPQPRHFDRERQTLNLVSFQTSGTIEYH